MVIDLTVTYKANGLNLKMSNGMPDFLKAQTEPNKSR
jgi:hypothetical protein